MKKIIGLLMALMLLAIGTVSAAPTFEVHKFTSVDGDWKWDNDQWNQGVWETATYQLDVVSETSLVNYYGENEELGNPWEYRLQNSIVTQAPTELGTTFSAWTVNDPATTPATGGYTTFSFAQNSYGDFGESHLMISGEGAVDISTYLDGQSGIQQDVEVTIN